MAGTDDRLGGEEAVPEMGQPSSFSEHLVNSLVTSSNHAGYIYGVLQAALGEQPKEGRSQIKRLLANAMRKAETLCVTHKQLAELVRGEDLDTRDLRRVREAKIYSDLRTLQRQVYNGLTEKEIPSMIEDILEYIREDNSVN